MNLQEQKPGLARIFDGLVLGIAENITGHNVKKLVLPVDGYPPSSVVFLAAVKAMDRLGYPRSGIAGKAVKQLGRGEKCFFDASKLVVAFGGELREEDQVSSMSGEMQFLSRDLSERIFAPSRFEIGVNPVALLPKTVVAALLRQLMDDAEFSGEAGLLLGILQNADNDPQTALFDFLLYHLLHGVTDPEKLVFYAKHAFFKTLHGVEILNGIREFFRKLPLHKDRFGSLRPEFEFLPLCDEITIAKLLNDLPADALSERAAKIKI